MIWKWSSEWVSTTVTFMFHSNTCFLLNISQLIQKGPIRDNKGRPLATPTDESNPWWSAFKQAVLASGGKLAKPEILSSTTDARFMRQMGIPALGFSPMANTPILLHDHNEVYILIFHLFPFFSSSTLADLTIFWLVYSFWWTLCFSKESKCMSMSSVLWVPCRKLQSKLQWFICPSLQDWHSLEWVMRYRCLRKRHP